MIIYTPLDLPRIEPDDWDIFWKIWNDHAKPMYKKLKGGWEFYRPDKSLWHGIDIYKETEKIHAWPAPYYDIQYELPNLYNLIKTLPLTVERARLVESKESFGAHTDDNVDKWVARAHFYNQAAHGQWFFTAPGGIGEKFYMSGPEDTNWFAFNDRHCWHGTDYDSNRPKILLQIYTTNMPDELISRSIDKYKGYTISL